MVGETNQTVEFEELDNEGAGGSGKQSEKLEARISSALQALKATLKPEEYARIAGLFGVKSDLTNTELLAELEKLVKSCTTPYPEEEAKKKKAEMASGYKDFMTKCMKDGKDLKTCADEWKKKYPEPAKAMEADFTALDAEIGKAIEAEKAALAAQADKDKRIETLEGMVKTLTETVTAMGRKDDQEAVKLQVNKLVEDKNITPAQAEAVLKLSVGMKPEERETLLSTFRKQKLTQTQDTGALEKHSQLDPDKRKKILARSGLLDLIEEKGASAARKQLENN